jgi:hypothetical protein
MTGLHAAKLSLGEIKRTPFLIATPTKRNLA